MKRLIAVLAIALSMTIAAACQPDDAGGSPGTGGGSPSLESVAPPDTSPASSGLPMESPAAS